MVTPSRLFAPTKPLPAEQPGRAAERGGLHAAFGQEGAEISTLSDETRLETGRPALTRDGHYLVNVTMTVGADQHRRTVVVKARAGETEGAVKQRVHSAFVRSVCDARSVVLAPPPAPPAEEPPRRPRRVQVR